MQTKDGTVFGAERFDVPMGTAIGWEAVHRLLAPIEVMGGLMAAVAAAGLAVNAGVLALLHGGGRDNLNIRGAAVHVLGDLLGSVAAIAAAAVILLTGWTPIDPLLSMLVFAAAYLLMRSPRERKDQQVGA